MTTPSRTIVPHIHLHRGPGIGPERTWTLTDLSTAIYPKLPNGQSIKVVIIRRLLTSNTGTTFKICRNAGKVSYNITYAYANKPTRVNKHKFVAELNRLGVEHYTDQLFEGI